MTGREGISNLNKFDFTPLDTTGIWYHKWVRDVRNHLKAQGIISAIREPIAAAAFPAAFDDAAAAASQAACATTNVLEARNAKTIIIMIRHIDESLQSEHLNEKDPCKLWVALEE